MTNAPRAPVPPPSVGINVAELHPAKLGGSLRRRWHAGELRLREVNELTLYGTLDADAIALVEALGGRVLHRGPKRDSGLALAVQLPNEALPFLLPQTWLSYVDMPDGRAPLGWSAATTSAAAPVDPTSLAPNVLDKLDSELHHLLRFEQRDYTVSGTVTIAGCLDDARREVLVAMAMSVGFARADPGCEQTKISFITPVVMVPRIAALPWVISLRTEPQAEPAAAAATLGRQSPARVAGS